MAARRIAAQRTVTLAQHPSETDERLMLRRRPGVFAAGEMLDWEAPTGGYLLQGCMATGVAAGQGASRIVEVVQHLMDDDGVE